MKGMLLPHVLLSSKFSSNAVSPYYLSILYIAKPEVC